MPAQPRSGAGPGKGSAKKSAKKSAKPCPICGKPAAEASRPFCSERCRDVDLNRWLSGSYAIPVGKNDDEDAE
jgi:endogenous inhibitor of DNA gyrase (YacG/DUF329 family)